MAVMALCPRENHVCQSGIDRRAACTVSGMLSGSRMEPKKFKISISGLRGKSIPMTSWHPNWSAGPPGKNIFIIIYIYFFYFFIFLFLYIYLFIYFFFYFFYLLFFFIFLFFFFIFFYFLCHYHDPIYKVIPATRTAQTRWLISATNSTGSARN